MVQIVGEMLIRDGALLMGLRAKHKDMLPNCWDVVGGHVEAGETPQETLVREVAEEIDVVVTGCRFLDVVVYDLPGRPGLQQHLFQVDAWRGEPRIANEEHAELRWFDWRDLQSVPDDAFVAYRPLLKALLCG